MLDFKEWLITENTGWKTVAYHRTSFRNKSDAEIANSMSTGFKIGKQKGDFGPGVYLFANTNALMRPEVIEKYGDYVVKAYCDLNGFLILEPKLAKSLYGTDSLADQLKIILGMKALPPKLEDGIRKFEGDKNANIQVHPDYTRSGSAALPYLLGIHKNNFDARHNYKNYRDSNFLHPYTLLRNLNLISKIRGMYFYGDTATTQELVIVAFDASKVTPFAYAKVPLNTSLETANWTRFDVNQILKNKTYDNQIYRDKPLVAPPIPEIGLKVNDVVALKTDIELNRRMPDHFPIHKYRISGISNDKQEIFLINLDDPNHSLAANPENIQKLT